MNGFLLGAAVAAVLSAVTYAGMQGLYVTVPQAYTPESAQFHDMEAMDGGE